MKSMLVSAVGNWLAFTREMRAVKKIRAARKLRAVQKIRAESGFLRELRERLVINLEGSRCLVIGSAPSVIVPALARGDRCICVNGSPYVASRFGVANPELTVICGLTTALKSEKSRATIPILRGLRTQEIIFVQTVDNEEHARVVLDEVGFQWDRFTKISTHERAAIIGEVCGVELGLGNRNDKVSNGIFAATMAAWAGAREIVMCGFSLKGGHSYLDGETPRYNLSGDVAFFTRGKELNIGLKTTSVELHEACGIPLTD